MQIPQKQCLERFKIYALINCICIGEDDGENPPPPVVAGSTEGEGVGKAKPPVLENGGGPVQEGHVNGPLQKGSAVFTIKIFCRLTIFIIL
jgi:hypothetical protein